MTTKADLYRLIDALPERVLPQVERLLAELESEASVPYTPLAEAPCVEPEADELASLAEARAKHAEDASRRSHAELRRGLGL